ncbi:polysaccharide pyruvyl transferase family protein [Methanolobus sp. ZRKC2]|uniref:polysaccharide pyruvyl transferase family protein n=1 Tax=Methanolobus sp. ZRKC2 TaxID=3125783 RepID=UPI0032537308
MYGKIRSFLRKKSRCFLYNIKVKIRSNKIFLNDFITVWWWDAGKDNWGDALNPFLVEYISGKKPLKSDCFFPSLKINPTYSVIGSILEKASNKEKLIIWGSGFLYETGQLNKEPLKIAAVRGPLTRNIILNQGIECPEIYGDPALLLPRYYFPKRTKKYKLGVIPHHIDQDNSLIDNFRSNKDVLIIDILGDIHEFVDDICSCENVASSSLHGLIAADSYGVPSVWIKLSDKILGDGFKFRDYYLSIKKEDVSPMIIDESTTVENICAKAQKNMIQLDLDKLLDSCPFK